MFPQIALSPHPGHHLHGSLLRVHTVNGISIGLAVLISTTQSHNQVANRYTDSKPRNTSDSRQHPTLYMCLISTAGTDKNVLIDYLQKLTSSNR